MGSTPPGHPPSDSAHSASQPTDSEPPGKNPPPQEHKTEQNGAGFVARIGSEWATRDTIVALVAAALGAAVTVGLTFFIAPWQEVATQRAVEGDRDSQDRTTPPADITSVQGETTIGVGYVSDASTPLNGVTPPRIGQWDDIASVLPDAIFVAVPDTYTDGAGPGAYAVVDFTLRGQHHKTVRITDINVVVTERKPAPAATLVYYPPRLLTSGIMPSVKFDFDLDSPDTSARALDPIGNVTKEDYFRENTVTLAENESISFQSKVFTSGCSCTYVLEAHFDDGSTVRLGQGIGNKRAFTLTAMRPKYQHYYVPQTSGPTKQPVLVECPSFVECRHTAYQDAPP